jgi:thiamine transport system permease protein
MSIQRWLPGVAAFLLLLALLGLPFLALLNNASHLSLTSIIERPYVRHVIGFSFWQATLSTLLAVGLAIPVAHSLARQSRFWGRSALIRLCSISLVIPTIVAIFGIVSVFGNQGWINQFFQFLGLSSQLSIYGLSGILITHVFFNLPLAARIMLHALEKIPSENWRLACQLGINSWDSFKLIQLPVLKSVIPGIALLIFSLCFTSFTIVMTLGGGPRATTIEVAVYQALRFNFDLDTATGLALIQLILCLIIILISSRLGKATAPSPSKGFRYARQDGKLRSAQLSDSIFIILTILLVSLPFIAVLLSGINSAFFRVLMDASFWQAVLNTLSVALLAGAIAVLLALGLLTSSVHLRVRYKQHVAGKLLELSGSLVLIIPPLVLGTGIFILLRNYTDVFALALLITLVVNALMSLPFAIRILENPMIHASQDHDKLCASLGIDGFNRFKLIEWPTLRKPIALAMAFSSTLAAGDLSVIALFGSQDIRTLPLLLYQRMGSYQLEAASVTALMLLMLCLLLFWSIEYFMSGNLKAGATLAKFK